MAIDVGNNNLETVSPPQLPLSPNTNAQNVSNLTSSLADAGRMFLQNSKAKVLGDIAGEAQGIVTETSQFNQAKDSIIERLSETDKNTFDRVAGDLRRLRNGEVQGILSPGAAQMRLQALAKQYINRYPRLAGDIRNILKVVSGDITPEGDSSTKSDPVLKAKYALVEEATSRGISPQELLAYRRAEDDSKYHKMQLEDATQRGEQYVPQLMWNLIDSKSVEVFGNLIEGMTTRMKQGHFVKENEIGALQTALSAGVADIDQQLTKFELDHGVKLDHKQFIDRFSAPFAPLIAMASQVDSTDKAVRLSNAAASILKNNSVRYLYNLIGPAGPAGAVTSSADLFSLLEEKAKITDQIKAGWLPNLEQEAVYNPKTRYLLDSLKGDGEGWQLLNQDMHKILTGENPGTTGNDFADKLRAAIIARTAASPGSPKEQAATTLTNYIKSGQPAAGILANPRLQQLLRDVPEAQTAVDYQMKQNIVSLIDSTPLKILKQLDNNIEFNVSDNAQPVKNHTQDTTNPTGKSGFLDALGRASTTATFGLDPQVFRNIFMETPGQAVANELSDYMKVVRIYKTPTEAQTQVENLFFQELNRKINEERVSIEELSKAKQPSGNQSNTQTKQ